MEKTLNKKIERKFSVWIYLLLLFISFIPATFLESSMTLNSLVNQFNLIFAPLYGYMPYGLAIFLRLMVALVSVGLFELFARLFCAASNAFSFGAVRMKGNDFAAALRVFMILQNLLLGLLNLCFYLWNFLIPLGMIVLSFIIKSATYFMFFVYINKYYLDPKTAHRAFRTMALMYLLYSFFTIAGGIIQ